MDTVEPSGGPVLSRRWIMPDPAPAGPGDLPADVRPDDEELVRSAGAEIDGLYDRLRVNRGRPDEQTRDQAVELLRDAAGIVRGSAWSPAADKRARAEAPGNDELAKRIARIEAVLADDRREPAELGGPLGTALRLGAGVFVGAVVAGPLAALVPTGWVPLASETLKAAIGGGVGVLTAELTKPLEQWLERTAPGRPLGDPAIREQVAREVEERNRDAGPDPTIEWPEREDRGYRDDPDDDVGMTR